MGLADRLGWLALIVALVGIGVTILWPNKRWIGYLALLLAAGLGGTWGLLELNASRDATRPAPPAAANRSALTITAHETNITYPEGENVSGILWEKQYGDVRVAIQTGDDPIQNFDITVQLIGGQALIYDMGQSTAVTGVEFHWPELPDISFGIRGADGSSAISNIRDQFGGTPNPGQEWKVFCPRLSAETELRLVLATATGDHVPAMPTHVRLWGHYQVQQSEGTATAQMDVSIPIKQP